MAFDPSTAKPVEESSGFDIASAKPVGAGPAFWKATKFVFGFTPPGMALKAAGAIDEATKGAAEFAGGRTTDIAANAGLPANVAAGLGYAANVGVQALPVIAGSGIGSKAAPAFENLAQTLMRSAVKPSIKDSLSGKGKIAIDTLFEKGLNPTMAGVESLEKQVSGLNNAVNSAIANSGATIDKQTVANAINNVTQRILKRNPTPADALKDAGKVYDEFINNPAIKSRMSIQQAQDFKVGLHEILRDEYGKISGASMAAKKALARGLREEIGKAQPAVTPLLEEEKKLITTLNIIERRALSDLNKNPASLAWLAHSPETFAMYMADKSAAFKSVIARMLHAQPGAIPSAVGATTGGLYDIYSKQAGQKTNALTDALLQNQER